MTPGDYADGGDEDVGSEPYPSEAVGVVLEVEREEWYESRYDEYPPALLLDLAVEPAESPVLFDPGGDEAAGGVAGHEEGEGEPRGCPDRDVDGSEYRAEGEASQQRERRAGEKGYGRDGVARDKDQRGGGAETFYEVAEAAEVF